MVLGFSLQRSGWPHETRILVTSEVGVDDRYRLSRFWSRIVEVEPIQNPHPVEQHGLDTTTECYTKLRVWQQTDLTKLVYIDADAIVLGDLEPLLDRPSFSAAPCMWPSDIFNAGVLVLDPSQDVFNDMVPKIGTLPSYDGSDQGFLNSYFPDWFTGPSEHRLPAVYNASQVLYLYAPTWRYMLPRIRILHFMGPVKPWNQDTRLRRNLLKHVLVRFGKSPGELPTPTELWWGLRSELPD
jgi:glycogenin glucosyltransferase